MMTVAESRTVRVTVTPEYYASDTQAIMIQLENLKLNLLFFYYFSYHDTSDSDFSSSFLYHHVSYYFRIILGVTVAAAVRRGIRVLAQSCQCQDLQALADTNSRSNIISCPGDSESDRGSPASFKLRPRLGT